MSPEFLCERMSGLIIRERDYAFVMIEQHHHAQISAEIIGKWRDYLFHHDPLYKSVMYAIEQHDCGWRFFDEQPFWNDAEQAPYAFTNFPTMAKSVLYTKGIDEVEALDPYAAVLCSAHYTKFLEKSEHREARRFVERENLRRERILSQLEIESMNIVDQHLALLQFADNISLYLCLNEPGAKKEAEHFFFKRGIPVSQILKHTISKIVQAYWHGQ